MAKQNQGSEPKGWGSTYGTHLAGQAAIDGADAVAIEMEDRWGVDRLRLLVSADLRERFDKQRFKFNSAIFYGDLQTLQKEAERMVTAWRALDRVAEAEGMTKLAPCVLELGLADGTVAAIVPDRAHGKLVDVAGRKTVVYSHEEIATMLSHYREVVTVKEAFPGAEVTAIRRTIEDPLNGFRDGGDLNDPIPEFMRPE